MVGWEGNGAAGNGCGTGSDTGGCRGLWHHKILGRKEKQEELLQKNCVKVSLSFLNVWSHQGIPNKWELPFLLPLLQRKSGTTSNTLPGLWGAGRSAAVLGGLCWFGCLVLVSLV